MTTIRKMLYLNEPLTSEQIEQIKKADKMPITFDEDCPELTEAQLAEIAAIATKQRAERRKLNRAISCFQKQDILTQLCFDLAKGRQSGEEKGWLTQEYVMQHIKERYRNNIDN